MDRCLFVQWLGLRQYIGTDRQRPFSCTISCLHDHSATAPVRGLCSAALRSELEHHALRVSDSPPLKFRPFAKTYSLGKAPRPNLRQVEPRIVCHEALT